MSYFTEALFLAKKQGKKGLQINSGPNVDIVLAIVHCFSLLAIKAIWLPPQEKSYIGELLTAAGPL